MAGPDPRLERHALRRSVTAVLGALGIGWGLAVGSQMIVLDGAYAAIGLVVSWLLLLASRLVDRGATHRYPYGREAMTLLSRSPVAGAVPFVDPAMVLLSVVVLLPAPLRMVRTTFVELLEGAPSEDVQAPVRAVLDDLAARYELSGPELRMTKIGPKLYVEVDAFAAPDVTIGTEEELRQRLERAPETLPFDVWLNLELHPRSTAQEVSA
jgi:predicted Co/Zn/Cd cation transporter (cation efflux family)